MMYNNYIELNNTIPIYQPLLIVPIGCQYTFPSMEVCSGGFMVYYMPIK